MPPDLHPAKVVIIHFVDVTQGKKKRHVAAYISCPYVVLICHFSLSYPAGLVPPMLYYLCSGSSSILISLIFFSPLLDTFHSISQRAHFSRRRFFVAYYGCWKMTEERNSGRNCGSGEYGADLWVEAMVSKGLKWVQSWRAEGQTGGGDHGQVMSPRGKKGGSRRSSVFGSEVICPQRLAGGKEGGGWGGLNSQRLYTATE